MTHQLFNLPRTNPLNNSAQVTPGARLRFYLTGTTTPTPVYTTSALSVAHTQPVEADATGRLPVVYLNPEVTYKVTVSDSSDVLMYTVDPVNDNVLSQAIIGAILYPQTAAEIAAGVTPVSDWYPPYYPQRYGVTFDGATDDTTGWNSLFAVINQAGGAFVPVPQGTSRITSALTIPANTVFQGCGRDTSIFYFDGAFVGMSLVYADHIYNQDSRVTFRNVGFKGSSSALGGILIQHCDWITIDNCEFRDFTATGGYGVRFIEVYRWWIKDTHFENIDLYGFHGDVGDNTGVNAGTFGPRNEVVGNNQSDFIGVFLDTTQNVAIFGNDFEGSSNGLTGIRLDDCEGIHIHDNYNELWLGHAIDLGAGGNRRVLIEQNVLNAGNPIVDLNTSGTTNSNIIVRHNTFPDAGIGVTCINVGNCEDFVEYANDRDESNITESYTAGNKAVTSMARTATGTLTGCTTSPTADVHQERIGNLVIVQIPAITATSNSTSCTLTGAIDPLFYPDSTQTVIGRYQDNGVDAIGLFQIGTTGTITIFNAAGNSSFFTASGTKGFLSMTISFHRTP